MTTTNERTELLSMLADQRDLFRITLRRVDEDQARQRSTVSDLTLGGLLNHVSNCERHWLQTIVERDENSAFDPAAAANEYAITDTQTVEGLLREWDEIAKRTEELVLALPSLEDLVPLPTAPWAPEREWWSVRKILLHVFREIAHHSGHADIIRESLDGQNSTYSRVDVDEETVQAWMSAS
jgi:uncharacterized damage-inducible protein DinB